MMNIQTPEDLDNVAALIESNQTVPFEIITQSREEQSNFVWKTVIKKIGAIGRRYLRELRDTGHSDIIIPELIQCIRFTKDYKYQTGYVFWENKIFKETHELTEKESIFYKKFKEDCIRERELREQR